MSLASSLIWPLQAPTDAKVRGLASLKALKVKLRDKAAVDVDEGLDRYDARVTCSDAFFNRACRLRVAIDFLD